MRLLYSALLMLLSICCLYGKIDTIQNIQDLDAYFIDANSQTLGVFDIDYTLIQPKEPAFQAANMARYQSVLDRILQQLPLDKRDVLINLINMRTQAVLIDPSAPQFFHQLQKRNIPFMGLTKDLTGPLGEIKNIEEWKVQILKNLGINFSEGSLIKDKIVFTSMPPYRGNYPVYIEGILFANGSDSKGKVFVKFLETFCLTPEKVIFVDYEEKNLQDVESALKQLNKQIDYQGLLFTGARQADGQQISQEQFKARWEQMANLSRNF